MVEDDVDTYFDIDATWSDEECVLFITPQANAFGIYYPLTFSLGNRDITVYLTNVVPYLGDYSSVTFGWSTSKQDISEHQSLTVA
jgi:hypothetical protein